MTRRYAAIQVDLLLKPDFRALSPEAQRAYLLLVCNPALNSAGVLPLMWQKLASLSTTTTREDVAKALAELDEADWALVDESTEEILVRSYLRHDGSWKSSRPWKGAVANVERIESPRLIRRILVELGRITPEPPCRALYDELVQTLTERVSEGVSETPSHTPSLGVSAEGLADPLPEGQADPAVAVAVGGTAPVTSLVTLGERRNDASPPPEPKAPRTRGTRLPDDWTLPDDWRQWAIEHTDVSGSDIDAQGIRFGNYWQAKAGREATKVNWLKTWQNWITPDSTRNARPAKLPAAGAKRAPWDT